MVGRLSPEKELEKVLVILREVRWRGHDVGLTVVGDDANRRYARRIEALARSDGARVCFRYRVDREELEHIMATHRYGIHGMRGEHFGIAPAEMQRAGCIVFVPDDGGTTEIVGGDERVIYRDVEDAVGKIAAMLSTPAHEASLRAAAASRADLFTEERFMNGVRDVVGAAIERASREID